MIDINLLPKELRIQKISYSKEKLLLIVPFSLGLLIFMHFYFLSAIVIKNQQYKSLNKRWNSDKDSQQKVEVWKKQYDLVGKENQDFVKLVKQRIVISDKLRTIGEVIPDGVWLRDLSVKQKEFRVEASAVSLTSGHMTVVRGFLEQLKKDNTFFSDFSRIEIGPVKMRQFAGYQIMDFTLEGVLK